jgi:hypothetical protein
VTAFAASAHAEAPARVEICHIPPGDPDAPQTITVSEKALAAHLGHEDLQAACDDSCVSDAGACDDGNACTSDRCDGGRCSNEPLAPEACDDGELTTSDRCEPAIGCVNDCVGQPTDAPCGFENGTFTLLDPETQTCDEWLSVQISLKFEADILNGEDVDGVAQQLEAAKPALIAGLQEIFASFTPSLTLVCEDIAVSPSAGLSWFGQLFSVDLLYAIESSALPAGATESTVVSKIQTEFAADPTLFEAVEQLLTDLANGISFSYITTNVY